LKEDILYLARSLGLAAYVHIKRGAIKETGFVGKYWRILISGDLSVLPMRVKRKQCLARQQKKNVLHTGFTIVPLNEGEYFGFEVAGPDRMFLLGDFTIVHARSNG
jgi:hypothetical protein